MNLSAEQRAALIDRLAVARRALVNAGADTTPLPKQTLQNHEAMCFVEYEEWRLEQVITTTIRLHPMEAA